MKITEVLGMTAFTLAIFYAPAMIQFFAGLAQ